MNAYFVGHTWRWIWWKWNCRWVKIDFIWSKRHTRQLKIISRNFFSVSQWTNNFQTLLTYHTINVIVAYIFSYFLLVIWFRIVLFVCSMLVIVVLLENAVQIHKHKIKLLCLWNNYLFNSFGYLYSTFSSARWMLFRNLINLIIIVMKAVEPFFAFFFSWILLHRISNEQCFFMVFFCHFNKQKNWADEVCRRWFIYFWLVCCAVFFISLFMLVIHVTPTERK